MDNLKQLAGRLGGRSKSPTKRASSAANLKLARLKRWPGREAAAAMVAQAQKDGGPRAAACIAEAAENLRRADEAEAAGDPEEVAIQEQLAQTNMAAAILNAGARRQTNVQFSLPEDIDAYATQPEEPDAKR